jgi:hypothetical protein
VHLSLNQGTTSVREEFEGRAREILKDRADLMRKRIADFADALPVKLIDLGSNGAARRLCSGSRTRQDIQAKRLA